MSVKPSGNRTSAPPLLKNASSAPFIHFDSAPVYGAFAGHIEVEIASRVLMPKDDGRVVAEVVCTGHLRCTPQAAIALADALTKALAMNQKHLAALAAEVAERSEGQADKAA